MQPVHHKAIPQRAINYIHCINMKQPLLLAICLVLACPAFCQLADLARVEYTIVPGGSGNVEFNRKRALINIPIKIKEDNYLVLGLDYSSIDLVFSNQFEEFNQDEIEDFQMVDFNIAYTFKINDDWRFAGRVLPGISSNLKTSDLQFKDAVISADAIFIKDKKNDSGVKKPYRLILGVSYSGNRGLPFPLPFISYYKRFHPKWSYNLGVPITNLQYRWSELVRTKLFASLDGFNSNLQRRLEVNDQGVAEQIRMSLILGGLRNEINFSKHLELFVITTYILNNVVQLRDANHDTLFEIDNINTFHFRAGLRFKI